METGRARPEQLADRPLKQPALSRLPRNAPHRDEILAAHESAVLADQAGYLDPETGLFVLTAKFLVQRGFCCERGCRHCPYVVDGIPDSGAR